MPKALENKIRKQGIKEGLKGEDLNHYIYGTMTNIKKQIASHGKKGKKGRK